MISSCGHDSRNKYWGDAAGDQSGTEWYVRPWYKGGWDEVLVHPDAAVREAIARNAERGAANPNVGYDQYQRLTFFNALKATGWDASKIAIPCEADCSSSTAACVIAAGHLADAPKLQGISPGLTTWSIGSALQAVGFSRLTEKKYLQSDAYLPRGAIINRSNQHVIINVTDGSYAANTVTHINGYDSREDTVDDKTMKQIGKYAADEVWSRAISGKTASKRLVESSDDATSKKDPTGRGMNLTTHDHVKYIASVLQQLKGEVDELMALVQSEEA